MSTEAAAAAARDAAAALSSPPPPDPPPSLRLRDILSSCAKSVERGDSYRTERLVSELGKFLGDVSVAAAEDEDTHEDAFKLLSGIYEDISPLRLIRSSLMRSLLSFRRLFRNFQGHRDGFWRLRKA
ncbi:hypothetical protein NL676_035198 [Syzygium grande]|nr:hypothetical protein NL676_035198 [Syzygium grande]